jgi:DNA-binding winged helix-turn-helix (wHTH) protein
LIFAAHALRSGSSGAEMLYLFDNFVLDPARRELRRGDALVAVQPQVFDLLEYLITNRDRVVSKDDILGAIVKSSQYPACCGPVAS